MLGFPGNLGHNIVLVLGRGGLLVNNGLDPVLVVVDVPLPVNGLDLLDGLVPGDVLLDDSGGGLGADLGRVGLVGSRQAGSEGEGGQPKHEGKKPGADPKLTRS